MGRKKVDVKIRLLIERCVESNQRSLLFILGPKSRDQIVVLHHTLNKARNRVELQKPSILWCFKKESGFKYVCHKKQRLLKKKYSGSYSVCEEDSFDHFLVSSNIKFCHYNDTTSVLGQTFGMLIIQDFEAITPNILSHIIECIEGSGMIIMILSNNQSLQEISSLKMDAHSRYLTSAHSNIDPVFNSRFIFSLVDCKNALILDDNLNILLCPVVIPSVSGPPPLVIRKLDCKLQKEKIDFFEVLNRVSSLCCTADQANALKTFISTLQEKCTNSVVSLTSGRGRGKSAALGLAVSCALYLKYSNIYVTSPQLENLQTLFSFIRKGMDIFDYKEGDDYTILFNTEENMKFIAEINIFHDHKQVVKYINPTEFPKVGISDLVVIDEAAAIPLPIVKSWMKSSMIFMASTVNGYEGTGRSLSLKLMSQLRELSQWNNDRTDKSLFFCKKNFVLKEIELSEPIRYADGDHVEAWLNNLFCLNSEINYLSDDIPNPESCKLYYVDRKILFSYQSVAEKFLQQLVALFVSSHYRNSPNDLLMMADAPSHHIFCLLSPVDKHVNCLPNVLCVIQVALEGKISKDCVIQELSHGKRASGDLIPWIVSQQFQDSNFPLLSGARIVRIATHPHYQRMGYGQRALQLLFSYYAKSSKTSSEFKGIRNEESTLLWNLDELEPEELDYIGVSYGLTLELLSETTGEHSCIMIKSFKKSAWLPEYLSDFVQRFTTLLTSAFQKVPAALALEILCCKRNNISDIPDSITNVNISSVLTECSLKRLEAYSNHLVDYHLIMDLMPVLGRSYFLNYFKDYFLSSIEETILLCVGLQNKSIEEISLEVNMETNQIMGLFKKIVKKILHHFTGLQNGTQNQNLKNSVCCFKETHNSSNKGLSYKRKNENSCQKQSKKERNKTPS